MRAEAHFFIHIERVPAICYNWQVNHKSIIMSQSKIQEMYNELKQAEKKKKELNQVIKEAYENYKELEKIKDEMNKLKAQKKQIEEGVRAEYSSEFNDLDDVKTDIKDMKMVLSDLMWNEIMKNNSVEITDEHDNVYVPQVMVSLQKK